MKKNKKRKILIKIDTMENKLREIGNIDISKNSYNKYRRCTDINAAVPRV